MVVLIRYLAVILFTIIFSLFLFSCSVGRYHSEESLEFISLEQEPDIRERILQTLEQKNIEHCLNPGSNKLEQQENTVFVHPGWIFILNWGGDRAKDAGLLLVRDGFAGSILEVRSRKADEIYERMISEAGTHYLGVHYSMGGSPWVLKEVLDATEGASNSLNKHIVYSPILVEPFQFSSLAESIDLDNPHLGDMIIVVSDNFSFLRPNIKGASEETLEHAKLHFMYAEDFGLNWGHFSFLSDLRRSKNKSRVKNIRALELFHTVVTAIQTKLTSNEIDILLAHLKIKYAYEDGRNIYRNWFNQGVNELYRLAHLCSWDKK